MHDLVVNTWHHGYHPGQSYCRAFGMPVNSDVNGGVNMQGDDHSVSMLVRMIVSTSILLQVEYELELRTASTPYHTPYRPSKNLTRKL